MKEDKSNQIIKQRIFWTDYSVNIVLDTLCPGLYDSSCFVRISDNFSYKAKKSKENFGKGINNCVFQETVEGVFIPYMLCLLSRKKSRKDHSAIYQLLYSWIMNMFIP